MHLLFVYKKCIRARSYLLIVTNIFYFKSPPNLAEYAIIHCDETGTNMFINLLLIINKNSVDVITVLGQTKSCDLDNILVGYLQIDRSCSADHAKETFKHKDYKLVST